MARERRLLKVRKMTVYTAPVRDIQFVLNEVLEISRFSDLAGFSELSDDLLSAILEEAAKLAGEVLHPLNTVGDKHGCQRADDGSVTTPPGFSDAYQAFTDGGWQGVTFDPKYGGQGLPYLLGVVISEMVSASNMSFGMYPGLSRGAAEALHAHASDEIKQTYLPKMIEGTWSGTMNLTEPHCGTDLGLLKTKAVPQGDGTYKISGQKIWISAGEHDLTENIIHLVLARMEGAPDGVKGISLFVVPKFFVEDDGSLGARNSVTCGGLEEKMGIHGNATCVMNYDDATGWLVGAENKGLKAMFVMMNEARLGVGLQGLAISEVSYQNAVIFARERLQGRALTGTKFPDKPADPIIVHPDVRRMLMEQRAFTEGARTWLYWTALQSDLGNHAPDEAAREKARDAMGLMTPILKSYLTEKGYWFATMAQQVLGGSGFTQEYGIEQFVRDVRIAMIYEGTNGIQALDLVGRKLPSKGGRAVMAFFAMIDEFIKNHQDREDLSPFVEALTAVKADAVEATQWFMANAMQNPDNAGAGAMDYLKLMALTCLTYAWAHSAKAALAGNGDDKEFYENKLITARYFIERLLPDRHAHLAGVKAGAETVMALSADAF